nr:hypothetical protein [Tanacetum cinerariifolium]
MGGSSSQRPKYPLMPPIHAFQVEEMYTPQFSDTFQENTSYSQELNRKESPIEAIAWTDGEEYALAKGWVDVSEHSKLGNSRKEAGFGVRFWRTWKANQNSTAVERMIWCARNGRRELPKFATESEGGSKRHKSYGSCLFNTESRDKARDAAKKKGSRASGSSSMNDEALARLMVTEMTTQEKEQRDAFIEIKRREVKCRER